MIKETEEKKTAVQLIMKIINNNSEIVDLLEGRIERIETLLCRLVRILSPACGHSACSQYYIETGNDECIQDDGNPTFEEARLGLRDGDPIHPDPETGNDDCIQDAEGQ